MDIHQLKTFVAVAREGSITRASELLHLSQPAVSAHIKAIEDAVGRPLFDRTSRGMRLTPDGERLLANAERTLTAHRELMQEAARIKGHLSGKLRLGAASNSNDAVIGRLLAGLSERCPEVEVALEHGTSRDTLAGLRSGRIDAGFYNEPGDPDSDLETLEVSNFRIYLAAKPALVKVGNPIDWSALADVTWIYPAASACCGRTAESLFASIHMRPKRILSVDREDVTRSLVAEGVGVGLLHAATAREAERRGELELLWESPSAVRVLFASLASRAEDPLIAAASAILRSD